MRLLCIGIALFNVASCTFGITQADVTVTSESTLAFESFAFDARAPALSDTTLVLRGDDLPGARATARIVGLVTSRSDELRSGVALPYALQGSALSLGVDVTGARADSMWIETLSVRLPRRSALLLTSPYVNVDIDGFESAITVLDAREVRVRGGGEVHLRTILGNIDASATSGTIASESGDIALAINAALTGPFALSTRVGEIVITRSAASGFVLTIDSPDCTLELDGRILRIGEDRFEQTVGDGGPRIEISQSPHVRIIQAS